MVTYRASCLKIQLLTSPQDSTKAMEQAVTKQFLHMEPNQVYYLKQRAYWCGGGEGEGEGTP